MSGEWVVGYRERGRSNVVRTSPASRLAPGVSVVIPTHLGADRIGGCLASLAAQTLASDRIEILVVSNGPADGTDRVIAQFCEEHPDVDVRTVQVQFSGAAMARNLGLALASREYVTFVDDDDYVSASYLAALLEHAADDVIVVGQVADVGDPLQPRPVFDSYIANALSPYVGTTQPVTTIPTALAFNAAKLVSTAAARAVGYDTSLRSGEDVVFWLQVALRNRLRLHLLDPLEQAVYYRHVRPDSVSRKRPGFDFSITQRLDVLAALDGTPYATTEERLLVERLMRAQIDHMHQFLLVEPGSVDEVLDAVDARSLGYFDREALLRGLADELVIAYAFPPWNDTSAGVMARRIQAQGRLVDVLCVDLDGLRGRDPSSARIVERNVARTLVVHGRVKPAFGSWRAISHFCVKGLARIAAAEMESGVYRSVYSRSMWPASHIAAALYKLRNPTAHWTAEFSDPMLVNSNGERRQSAVGHDRVSRPLRRALVEAGIDRETDNVWEWVELLPYLLADTIVFTNENQRAYMLEYCTEPSLVARVLERSVISAHPTLPERFYRMSDLDLGLDPDVVNLGYFGVFYASRGLSEVIEAIASLAPAERRRLRLHVFTDKPDELNQTAAASGVADVIVARPYLTYLDFLAATTQLDCLLVNDASTGGTHGVNPYLPSKWSDYRGSGTDVWAVVEPGSILSGMSTRYRSEVGDAAGAGAALRQILADHPARRREAAAG